MVVFTSEPSMRIKMALITAGEILTTSLAYISTFFPVYYRAVHKFCQSDKLFKMLCQSWARPKFVYWNTAVKRWSVMW